MITAPRQVLFSQLRGRRFGVYLAPSGTNNSVAIIGKLVGADGSDTTPNCIIRIREPIAP